MTKEAYIKFCKTHPDAQIPKYQTDGAAGMDVCTVERFDLRPGETKLVDTGLKAEIARGYELQVRPRSGLAAKHGITVLNAPGTIDSDYRGPIKVLLVNHGKETVTFMCPERIAQLVFAKVSQPLSIYEVDEESLSDTSRGEGGFGSTGK